MKKTIAPLLAIVLLASCKKEKDTDNEGINSDTAANIHITVYNATLWSPNLPYGAITAGATVSLYRTAADYPDDAAEFTTTDANGEAVFENIDTGSYYVVVQKNYMQAFLSNLVYFVDGVGGFATDSLFQSAPTAQEMPIPLNGAAGNFRFKDLNGDDVVNRDDMELFPAKQVTAVKNKTVREKILIGSLDNRLFVRRSNLAEIDAALQAVYTKLAKWHELQVTLDAVYTDEKDCTSLPAWCGLNGYLQTSSEARVRQYWTDGYSIISNLGNILANIEMAGLHATDLQRLTGETKALKGYVYLQLSNYFGTVVQQEYILMHPKATRFASQADMEQYIESLLMDAKTDLSAAAPQPDRSKAFMPAVWGMLARKSIQKHDYNHAYDYSNAIVSDNNFGLAGAGSTFTQADNKEIVWSAASQLYTSDIHQVFTKGHILPQIRFAEMLLINAEAAVEKGLTTIARDNLNLLRTRAGLTTYTSTDAAFLRDAVQEEWEREMANEGVRFAGLVRWNKTGYALEHLGFTSTHIKLPIPLIVQTWYFNVMQNVGYN
jgi:hypothetical protein